MDYNYAADKEVKKIEKSGVVEGNSYDYNRLASIDRQNISPLKINYESSREKLEYNPSSGSYS